MWNLDLDRVRARVPGPLGNLAVETGTCRGNGARLLARSFPRVVTIELSEELHRKAQERFRKEELLNVEALNGSSPEKIPEVVKGVPASETVFFYLDAHWSGDRTVDWSQNRWKGYGLDTAHLGASATPSGPEQVPLLDELRAIHTHCRARALVLMDDMDKVPESGGGGVNMGFPGEDWSHLSRENLLAAVKPRLVSAHFLEKPSQWLLELAPLPEGC